MKGSRRGRVATLKCLSGHLRIQLDHICVGSGRNSLFCRIHLSGKNGPTEERNAERKRLKILGLAEKWLQVLWLLRVGQFGSPSCLNERSILDPAATTQNRRLCSSMSTPTPPVQRQQLTRSAFKAGDIEASVAAHAATKGAVEKHKEHVSILITLSPRLDHKQSSKV